MTSQAFEAYRALEVQLVRLRWIHEGVETPEEDQLLDRMDAAWTKLSAEERALFRAEGTRSRVVLAFAWVLVTLVRWGPTNRPRR